MRVRQAPGGRGLVGALLAAALLPACAGVEPRPVRPAADLSDPAELRALIEELETRNDPAACLERARAYERLRTLKAGNEAELLRRGDAADLALLGQPAPPEMKNEAAARLSRHFRERGRSAGLGRAAFKGPLGDLLRAYVYESISAYFGEVASAKEHAAALERMAATAQELADHASLRPDGRDRWHARARACSLRAVERLGTSTSPPGADALKFSELDLPRRLEEATRCADYGTREKASRGDPERALEWYLLALCHFELAREVLDEPSAAQEHALAAREIVVRSLSELLCRE